MTTLSFSSYSCNQQELNGEMVRLDLDSLKDNSSMDLSGIEHRRILKPKILDKNIFTYKPKINAKSNMLAQNFLNFYERQNLHTQKQLEILEEAYKMSMNNYGKLLCSNKFEKNKRPSDDTFPTEEVIDQAYEVEKMSQLNNLTKMQKYKISNFPLLKFGSLAIEGSRSNPFLKKASRSLSSGPFLKRVNFTEDKTEFFGVEETVSCSSEEQNVDAEEKFVQCQKNNNNIKLNEETCVLVKKTRKKQTVKAKNSARLDEDLYDEERDNTTNLVKISSVLPDGLVRSKTMPLSLASGNKKFKESNLKVASSNNFQTDRLKLAKEEAERAIKNKKVFTIIGPYPAMREALKSRGWIEKFENMTSLPIKKRTSKKQKASENEPEETKEIADDGDDNNDCTDDDDYEEKVKPWDESNGYYGILSRCVRNYPANLIWTVRSISIDYNMLHKDTYLNHFNKNGAFTTKIGLCQNLKNLAWYNPQTADDFFPRCFKLGHEDDRLAFIDDYRLTCCVSLLKYVMLKYSGEPDDDEPDVHIMSAEEMKKMNLVSEEASSGGNYETENLDIEPIKSQNVSQKLSTTTRIGNNPQKKYKFSAVPLEAIDFAIEQLYGYIDFHENNDIDKPEEPVDSSSDEKWTRLYEWFYAACHDKIPFENVCESLIRDISKLLEKIKEIWPQYNIDGYRNIWIVKPGALSRGRGIIVFDKLNNILDLNLHPQQRDGRYVVQKYIERPLLIHKIKFDIRQWFLVTDFNPLSIWMYKDCYLRFCTQKFTLDNTQSSVHLCNYSIQKNFKNDEERCEDLPEENMWSNDDFIANYLSPMGKQDAWDSIIYAQMKNAIICSMQASQDIIESRKNTFELYGADFMIGEDLKPWLIEINCSPTMARSTEVTTLLCDNVQEDIVKVIIDRKYNKNASTGRFELIYKAPIVSAPSYVGIELKVDGTAYKKPNERQEKRPEPKPSIESTESKQQETTTITSPAMMPKIDKQKISADKNAKLDIEATQEKKQTVPEKSTQSRLIESIVTTINTDKNRSTTIMPNLFSGDKKSTIGVVTSKPKKELQCAPISIATSIHELTNKEQHTQSVLANYQSVLTSSQTKINSSNLSNISYGHLINNNTQSSTIASLQEKLKDINQNDLLLNARRRVHLEAELVKEFKTQLPREQKLFHFSTPTNHLNSSLSQNYKSTPHLTTSILADSSNQNMTTVTIQNSNNNNNNITTPTITSVPNSLTKYQNKVKERRSIKVALKAIRVEPRRDRVEAVNSLYSTETESVLTLKNIKNAYISEVNNITTLKRDSPNSTQSLREGPLNFYDNLPGIIESAPHDALKNKTPRNFLLESKKENRKSVPLEKIMEKPSFNTIKIGITKSNNIDKLMKKYSIV